MISHEEKAKPLASFDEMVKGLDKQKQMREQIFAQELSSMKDRDRILEEKFQEAMKRAEKDKDKPYRNPMDIDYGEIPKTGENLMVRKSTRLILA
jgi:hypothetical protein